MADCGNRHGSEIAGVRPEGTEVLISAEKLRGTDFWVGAIDATTWKGTSDAPEIRQEITLILCQSNSRIFSSKFCLNLKI